MFDLIDGLSGLMGALSQSSPNEKGTRNVVSHNACQSALTLFKPRYLFCFPVNLLNLPTQVAHRLCHRRVGLRQVVGYDRRRASRRRCNPEYVHLMVFGEPSEFHAFSCGLFAFGPS